MPNGDIPPTRPESVNPDSLDLVITDEGACIYHDGRPLTTPGGREMILADPRPLEHIIRELAVTSRRDDGGISFEGLLAEQLDAEREPAETLAAELAACFAGDPLIRRKSGPGGSNGQVQGRARTFLDAHGDALTFLYGGLSGILGSLNHYILEISEGRINPARADRQALLDAFTQAHAGLTPAGRAVVRRLSRNHGTGGVLPMLLVLGRLTPSEYANGVLLLENAPNRVDGAAETAEDIRERFHDIRQEARTAYEYRSLFPDAPRANSHIRELASRGEGFDLEFKSTLRQNLKTDRKDPAIEHACLKTLAAFLNTSGGTLLIGVQDDGTYCGIESDGFPNLDRFAQHFWNLVKGNIGVEFTPFIHLRFEEIDGKTVCAAACDRVFRPVFLNQKGFGEEFFIRVGPSTTKLEISEALDYIRERFVKAGS